MDHLNKNDQAKSRAGANNLPTQKSKSRATAQFVDNRPEARAQRKLQDIANTSSQAKKAAQSQAMICRPSVEPPAQFYFNTNAFTMGDNAEFTDQTITKEDFSATYQAPVTKRRDDYDNLPNLSISTNRRMAIEADAEQAKIFYGDQQTVDDSNAKLENTGVELRLQQTEGQAIAIPGRNEAEENKVLTKITPVQPNPEHAEQYIALMGFGPSSCDEVIRNIIGPANRVTVIANRYEKASDSSASHQLGGYIAEQQEEEEAVTAEGARDYAPNDKSEQEMADAYAGVDPAAMVAEANTLKINEHASPDVGEGFLIKSLSHTGTDTVRAAVFDSKEDHLEAIQGLALAQANIDIMRQAVANKTKALMNRWNEHYAGVVAKDGDDVVTLENYNRGVEVVFEFQRIFNNLFQTFEEFRDFVWEGAEDLDPPRPIMDLQEFAPYVQRAQEAVLGLPEHAEVNEEYVTALQAARTAMENYLAVNDVGSSDMIYFRMYGSGAQSFHAKWKGSADNPLTTRIRSSIAPEIANAKQTLDGKADPMQRILGSSSAPNPWGIIYGTYANRGNQWFEQTRQNLDAAVDISQAKQLHQNIAVEFHTWCTDLRQAIANQVKQVVGNGALADPVSNNALVQLIKHQIETNSYSSFDFTEEGYAKARKTKELNTLLPPAERLLEIQG